MSIAMSAAPSPDPASSANAGSATARDAAFTTPAFPFDTHPYTRLPGPLGNPATDLRIVRRRAIYAALVAWVPLAVLAAIEGLAVGPTRAESLLLDIAAYARYMVALPLLILSENVVLPRIAAIVRHVATSGLLRDEDRPRYEALVLSTRRLLSSRWTAVVLLALAFASTFRLVDVVYPVTMSTWEVPIVDGVRRVSLAGRWRLLVSQPLYVMMLGLWMWRALMWGRFLYKTSRFDLRLVASHPDHMGGLQFVTTSLRAFPFVGFAMASGVAGNVAQNVIVDGRPLAEFKLLVPMVLVLVLALFVGPLFSLHGPLRRLRTAGIITYGELASDVGVRFERQWLRPGGDVGDEALHAPDFSAVTDLYAIVANVGDSKIVPLDLQAIVPLVIATLLPFAPLLLLLMPFGELLKFAVNFLL